MAKALARIRRRRVVIRSRDRIPSHARHNQANACRALPRDFSVASTRSTIDAPPASEAPSNTHHCMASPRALDRDAAPALSRLRLRALARRQQKEPQPGGSAESGDAESDGAHRPEGLCAVGESRALRRGALDIPVGERRGAPALHRVSPPKSDYPRDDPQSEARAPDAESGIRPDPPAARPRRLGRPSIEARGAFSSHRRGRRRSRGLRLNLDDDGLLFALTNTE